MCVCVCGGGGGVENKGKHYIMTPKTDSEYFRDEKCIQDFSQWSDTFNSAVSSMCDLDCPREKNMTVQFWATMD